VGPDRGSRATAIAACFAAGLFVSEVLFGWATEEELQPNIDGLSFDEVLLGVLVAGLVVLVARLVAWRRDGHRTGIGAPGGQPR
jgi:hypothetical protein